jgi:hypothetical protein
MVDTDEELNQYYTDEVYDEDKLPAATNHILYSGVFRGYDGRFLDLFDRKWVPVSPQFDYSDMEHLPQSRIMAIGKYRFVASFKIHWSEIVDGRGVYIFLTSGLKEDHEPNIMKDLRCYVYLRDAESGDTREVTGEVIHGYDPSEEYDADVIVEKTIETVESMKTTVENWETEELLAQCEEPNLSRM